MKEITSPLDGGVQKLWLLSLFVKVVLAGTLPLVPDEAYYWFWSHHIDWSYYDHPAMVAWMFYLSQDLYPLGSIVRLPFVIMGHLTMGLWLLLLAPHLKTHFQKLFFWVFLLSPLLGLGSILGTPDVPLVFFWSLSLYFVHKLHCDSRLIWYALLGASLGLGFCSKYMIVLFLPSLAWHIFLLSREQRPRLLRPHALLVTAASGLLFSLPVFIWNYQNDWMSFQFQTAHGLSQGDWKIQWTLDYIGGQFLLLFPLLLVSLFRFRPEGQHRWLLPYTIVPLAFFFATSFRGHVEANWSITAFPSFLALVLLGAAHHSRTKLLKWTIGIFALANFALVTESYHHWIPAPKEKIKIHHMAQYEALLGDAQDLIDSGATVFTGSYQMAGALSFLTGELLPKLPGVNRKDFFDDLGTKIPDEFHAFLVSWHSLPAELVEQGFETVSEKKYEHNMKLIEVRKK